MYTVRANDTATSWAWGEWNADLGLNVKYSGELERTNCTMKYFNSSWGETMSQYTEFMHAERSSLTPGGFAFPTMGFPG